MQLVMEILTVVFALGAMLLLWIIILPSLKRFVRWCGAFNNSFNKWKQNKPK